jgi:hypothetical protein
MISLEIELELGNIKPKAGLILRSHKDYIVNKIKLHQDIPTAGFAAKQVSVADGLAFAAKQSGRGVIDVSREYMRLNKGQGKISITEYCTYRLFDSKLLTADEKTKFISDSLHWEIVGDCSDSAWFAAAEDKWLSSVILGKAGLKTPETVAVIDTSIRNYGCDRKITTADDLKSFLTEQVELPVFLKPIRSLASFGVFVITKADHNKLHIHSGDEYKYDDFFSNTLGENAYLIQKVIDNHDFIKKYTPNTATVRLQNLVGESDVTTPFAVLKIPASDSIADNYWRKGNLLCNIDVETGEIVSAMSGDVFDLEHHTHHPETGAALIGEVIPHWQDVREINRQCVKLFAPIRYQSLDVAITPSGPMIVENNFGGSMQLLQLASGTGFLTAEVKAFFTANGCDLFDGKKKKKKRLG